MGVELSETSANGEGILEDWNLSHGIASRKGIVDRARPICAPDARMGRARVASRGDLPYGKLIDDDDGD